MKIDLTFPHKYEISIFHGTAYNFDRPEKPQFDLLAWDHAERKICFLVSPEGKAPWMAIVSPGPFASLSAINAVYSLPNANEFCVVINGQALVMNIEGPGKSVVVPCAPVLDIKILPENELLVFTDYTSVTAWGVNGMAWRTHPVGFNGVEIIYSDANYIYGSTLDEDGPRSYAPFQIDIKTGTVVYGCRLTDPCNRITKTSVPVFDQSFVPPPPGICDAA